MLHIDQSFKCEYSFPNFNFSLSAFNVAIYLAVFTTPFEWDNSNFSVRMPLYRRLHAMRMVKCQMRV